MKLHEVAGEEQPEELTPAYKDTAEIKASVWPALQAKIEKLNRRAARIHVPPIALTIEKEHFVAMKKHEHDEDPRMEKYYTVKVEGSAPQVAGYKFIATIQHKDAGNIIRTVPGEENNEHIRQFYDAHPDYCDHCHKRRNRIDTFIVKGQDGRLRQIGRNCLADFLGGQDPKQILWYFSLRDLVNRAVGEASEETERRGRRGELGATPARVLSAAAAIIRTYGYVKASEANEEGGREPTSRKVRWAIFDRRLPSGPYSEQARQNLKELLRVADHPTPEDEELVKKAVEWFNTIPQQEKERSEFYHNIDVLLHSETVSPRDVGFVGAIFPAYHRATAQAKEQSTQATKKNEVVGTVGAKLPPTHVTVIATQNIEGQYGVTQLCRMEDAEGRLFVWFNSGGNRLDQGETLVITGTIKKHDEFKGRMQTILSRVKDVTPDPNAEPVKPKKVRPEPEMKWDLGQPEEQKPAEIPANTGAGSKITQAVAKFQEFQKTNGRIPTMGEFKQVLSQPPFNMSPAAASTYYYTAKKRAGGI